MKTTIKFLGLLFITTLGISMLLSSCVESGGGSNIQNVKKIITGTITYQNISAGINVAITTVNPQWQGIQDATQVVTYSIKPALPAGLQISATSGAISGTATTSQASTTYRVTVTGTGNFKGSIEATFTISVGTAITGTFTYASNAPIIVARNNAITPENPAWTNPGPGQTVTYSIKPTLPAGLQISATSGAISGTPTVASAETTYEVTATGTGTYGGTIVASLKITVSRTTITGTITYQNISAGINVAITTVNPQWQGIQDATQVVTYSITPALPAGLQISATSGAISGTATTSQASTTYRVTVTGTGNFEGSIEATFTISVGTAITGTFTYASNTPIVVERNNAITTVNPTWTNPGPGQTVTYSIKPTLPAGLQISATSGAISGTPTVVSAETTYVVTATGTGTYGGTIDASLKITVTALANIGGTFTYPGPSDNSGATLASIYGITTSSAAPTWSSVITTDNGSEVTYTIKKSDNSTPGTINIDANTGVITISNTATVAETDTYTITATGTGTYSGAGATTTIKIKVLAKPTTAGTYIRIDGVTGRPLYNQAGTYAPSGTAIDGTKWGCAYDYKGLYWEIKTDDNGLRDKDNTYAWGGKTAIGKTSNDANKGTYATTGGSWDPLIDAANGENTNGLCGFKDWRVPKKLEIHSLYDYATTTSPRIYNKGTFVFSSTTIPDYWVANPFLSSNSNAWVFSFTDASGDSVSLRTNLQHVRLVRGGTQTIATIEATYKLDEWPNGRYVSSNVGIDEIITDTQTGLMWMKCSEGLTGTSCNTASDTDTLYSNNEIAARLTRNNVTRPFAGFSDWRLPTHAELDTLAATHTESPAINTAVFPGTVSGYYWTSTDKAGNSNNVWGINFTSSQSQFLDKDVFYEYSIRLVRTVP